MIEINVSCLLLDDFPLYLFPPSQILYQTGGKQLQNKKQCHATTVPQYTKSCIFRTLTAIIYFLFDYNLKNNV
jgi:hypothetical protein